VGLGELEVQGGSFLISRGSPVRLLDKDIANQGQWQLEIIIIVVVSIRHDDGQRLELLPHGANAVETLDSRHSKNNQQTNTYQIYRLIEELLVSQN
jgi:hypothetical protein